MLLQIQCLQFSSKWIEETLLSGTNIICDRYYYSGMVYSAAKLNPSLSLTWAKSPDIGLPRPDRVIFLDLEAEDAERRGGFGEEKYEKKVFQQEVRKQFHSLQSNEAEEQHDMVLVNAGESIDLVGEKIWKEVQEVVNDVARKNDNGRIRRVQL